MLFKSQRKTLAALFMCVALLAALGHAPALASSHSEAPGTGKDRLADDTDLYAWVAADAPDAVTIVGNWVPLIEPNSGPNFASFDDNATYYMNVDNVGDSKKHVRFEFSFTTTRQNQNTFLYNTGVVTSLSDPDLNVRQSWTLKRIDVDTNQETVLGTGQVAPYFVGPVSMPDYGALAGAAVQMLPGGYKVFVGPRDDPFFVDLAAVFDLLSLRPGAGAAGSGKNLAAVFDPATLRGDNRNANRAVDGVGGYNVMSVVLQVPKSLLTKDGTAPDPARGNNVIGIWDTAERLKNAVINGDGTMSFSGPEQQVSRLGMPLVNEVVIPLGKKDLFNASEPANDVANFGASVVDPEAAKLLHGLFGINVPPAPRNDLVAVFATGVPGLNQPPNVAPGEMLRLNMAIAPAAKPSRFGVLAGDVAGFPNGRRLADDVVDIELRVVAGVLVPGFNIAPNNQLGDGVDANDMPFLPHFPYVAPPQNPRDHQHHLVGEAKDPSRGRGGDGDLGAGGESLVSPDALEQQAEHGPALAVLGRNPGASAVLQYSLENPARVALRIYDVQGRSVRTLIDQEAAAGMFRANWDGADEQGGALHGVFFARLTANGRALETRKLVIE
jgi:hypothetical protein